MATEGKKKEDKPVIQEATKKEKNDNKPVIQEAPKKKKKFKCCCCGEWHDVAHIHRIMVRQTNSPLRYQGIKFVCNADIEVCSRCVRTWKGHVDK